MIYCIDDFLILCCDDPQPWNFTWEIYKKALEASQNVSEAWTFWSFCFFRIHDARSTDQGPDRSKSWNVAWRENEETKSKKTLEDTVLEQQMKTKMLTVEAL